MVEVVGSSPHINRQTHFAYDPAGRLSQIVAFDSNTGNQTTRYTYDARGNQVTTTYPVTGSVVSAYDSLVRAAVGRLHQVAARERIPVRVGAR